ncbi:ANTAR domain-containing protein [Nocardioides exalbidus]|uniref:ANTAR domain-containing protein n=1 Tax=Nocardioides exalbidus TaxID=402596 RepID=A0A1H4LX93_9ACTN|nr:GAF domain-containing protein [Nocardioides exalbidus]SEB75296.1 ANTAR domain-containing protein [Nocardioides exalbidus]
MSLASALNDVCRRAVDRLPVAGAVTHLMTPADAVGVGPVAASDARARSIGDLPFVAGVGPCHDAFQLRRPVLVGDLAAAAGRWPGYAEAALDKGVRAVFSMPLQVGAVGLGVIDLHADTVGMLRPDDLATAFALADEATHVLLTGTDDLTDAGLDEVVDHRAEIYQAQGALVVALGVSLADAMVIMRSHAFAAGLPLVALAKQVLDGTSKPEDW